MRAGRDVRRDWARTYEILVDGTAMGTIGAGEGVLIPVAPGQHSVRLKIDWLGSDTLTVLVNPGEIVSLACWPSGPSAPALIDIFRSTFGRKPWVELSPVRE